MSKLANLVCMVTGGASGLGNIYNDHLLRATSKDY